MSYFIYGVHSYAEYKLQRYKNMLYICKIFLYEI